MSAARGHGLNSFLLVGIVKPGPLPLRVEKRIGDRWRVMAWIGSRELAEQLIENGLGGECRIVEVGESEYRAEWREVA